MDKSCTPNQSIDPHITVIVWLDSFRIYTSNKKLNPDLANPCTTGNFGPAEFLETGGKMDGKLDPKSPYLLKNTSGLPALESWSKCHIFDHTKAVAREYWKNMCLNLTASGVIDGCGADASWQNGVDQSARWDISSAVAEEWDLGHKQMMRETTAALGDGGLLLGKQPYELVEGYVSGVLHEGCDANNETILMLQNLTALKPGEIFECHGKGNVNEMAAFLIGAGQGHYYGCGGWEDTSPDAHSRPEFTRKLGAPDGPGIFDGRLWHRTFASGTRVSFDPKNKIGNITWST